MSSQTRRPTLYIRLKPMMSGPLLLQRPSSRGSPWNRSYRPATGSHITPSHNFSRRSTRSQVREEICTYVYSVFLCQLTCQSADIMSSLCGVGVRVNNFFSKTTRPRDMLFFLKDTLSIEDEKLFKACKSVCSSVC